MGASLLDRRRRKVGMMTFDEYMKLDEDKRVQLYGISQNRKKDTSRSPGRLGVLFKAVNPADLGMPVVWKMNAGRLGYKTKRTGVVGKSR
jgi:hypothetical protein